ncbi:MAG: nitroreductase family deazaflavin-dependent oxidoreductase [Anaerolineae bacterium]|nr:nitroreductase family deazaflavin-dependent oxidoreductase [Anaerolineae bacterium]
MTTSTLDPRTMQNLRTVFKYFNRVMLLHWHLGLGRLVNAWPAVMGRYMVIVHTGRKSGKRRYTPVNYAEVDGELYCTAGFGNISDWYKNMQIHPEIEVWLPDGWWSGVAEDITDSPDKYRLLKQVLIGSGFVAPLLGVDPHHLSEAQLLEIAKDYRLVQIRRVALRTGSDGPGKWVWAWPFVATALAMLALRPHGRAEKR